MYYRRLPFSKIVLLISGTCKGPLRKEIRDGYPVFGSLSGMQWLKIKYCQGLIGICYSNFVYDSECCFLNSKICLCIINLNTMDKLIRKAILPAGGLGTRFLPATKASPKEMLPIVDLALKNPQLSGKFKEYIVKTADTMKE